MNLFKYLLRYIPGLECERTRARSYSEGVTSDESENRCEITIHFLAHNVVDYARRLQNRKLTSETFYGLQSRTPVRRHLNSFGIILRTMENRRKPISEQAELPDEKRQIFSGYKFEFADRGKLGHAGSSLNGDFEIFVFVDVVRECGYGPKRMRFDDDIDKLKLSGQSVKVVGYSRIVPNDTNIIISDVSFFVDQILVIRMRGHHGRGVK